MPDAALPWAQATGTLHALRCGSTVHDLARLVGGADHDEREFPATAFLWDDGAHRVLFDTGYAPEPWPRTLAVGVYRRLVPPQLGPADTVDARLTAIGVAPASVTHVVLSHAHPDHVGGLGFFPDAELVVTGEVAAVLDAPPPSPARLRAGVLRALLPRRRPRRRVLDRFDRHPDVLAGLGATDLLGDGRLLVVALPGHARGHVGLLVEGRMLLAGDAAWGRDLLAAPLRSLPALVAADRRALASTATALGRIEAAGVRLVFSHDAHPEGVDLLREDGAR